MILAPTRDMGKMRAEDDLKKMRLWIALYQIGLTELMRARHVRKPDKTDASSYAVYAVSIRPISARCKKQ